MFKITMNGFESYNLPKRETDALTIAEKVRRVGFFPPYPAVPATFVLTESVVSRPIKKFRTQIFRRNFRYVNLNYLPN